MQSIEETKSVSLPSSGLFFSLSPSSPPFASSYSSPPPLRLFLPFHLLLHVLLLLVILILLLSPSLHSKYHSSSLCCSSQGAPSNALDHDAGHTLGRVTPSVYLVANVEEIAAQAARQANNRLPSFYDGQVFFALKEAIFQPSSALRSSTELLKVLINHRGGKESVRPMLSIFTDGGPDHRTTFPSTWAALTAAFRYLDLDWFSAARTAPNNSWANVVERIMSILNIALQGTTCQREAITATVLQKVLSDMSKDAGTDSDNDDANLEGAAKEMEASLGRCGTMKEVRMLASKYQKDRMLKDAYIASHSTIFTELSRRFMTMALKEKHFKRVASASENDLGELFSHFSHLCDTEFADPSAVKKTVLQADPTFKAFWDSDHVHSSDYCITFMKSCWIAHLKAGGSTTDGFSCKFGCKPPRMDHASFIKLSPLPLPRHDESRQHYLPFSKVDGQPPSSADQPSHLMKVNEDPKVARGGCTLANARGVAMCTACDKPRLIYSALKLDTHEQLTLDQCLEDFDFVCGGALLPPGQPFGMRDNTPYVNTEFNCVDLLEKVLYSAKIVEKPWGIVDIHSICIACGSEGGEAPESKKAELAVAKLYPLCGRCQETRRWQTWGTFKGGKAVKAAKVQLKRLKGKATQRAVKRQKREEASDDEEHASTNDETSDVEHEIDSDDNEDGGDDAEGARNEMKIAQKDDMIVLDGNVLRGEIERKGSEAGMTLPEPKLLKKKRVLRRTGDVAWRNAKVHDDDDDDDEEEEKEEDDSDDAGMFERINPGNAAKDCKQRGASSNQLIVQSKQHMVQAVPDRLERASEQADVALTSTLVSAAKELLLVDIGSKTIRKLRAKTCVRFGRHLMCYNPPGDTLCGFRVLYFLLQLLIKKRLLLEGKVGDEIKSLSTTGLRAYLLNARTLDERARVVKDTPEHKRGWCATMDVERFANLTQISFWYAWNGYSDDRQLYRVYGFESALPARFILPFAVVYENEHFQLAGMSAIIQGIRKDVGPNALSVASDLKGLVSGREQHQAMELEGEGEAIDLSADFSYEDDAAVNLLLHTLDDVRWLQRFRPAMGRLGWRWVTGDNEYDAVYQLGNAQLKDDGQKVTGNEGLRQYFLSEGKVTAAPSYEGARKRRASARYEG
jgi:hypothetical protein